MSRTAHRPPVPGSASPDSLINTGDGRRYWEGVTADLNGMLGGIPLVSKADLQGSRNFLAKLGIGTKDGLRTVQTVLEGGAGIGRITKGLLLNIAEEVDVIEPIVKFTNELREARGVRTVFNVGLEEWQPDSEETRYDVIWIQWCLVHLTDEHVVQFLQVCRRVMTPETGFIVVKENLTRTEADVFDELDSSVIRGDAKFLRLFQEAGLKVLRTEMQRGVPKALYPIKSYALR